MFGANIIESFLSTQKIPSLTFRLMDTVPYFARIIIFFANVASVELPERITAR